MSAAGGPGPRAGGVDVVVPVYSTDAPHDRLLERTLASLVRQTYTDFGVIVVKNGCWAPTDRVVAPFHDRLRLTELTHGKLGGSAARNVAAAASRAAWIAQLDADDAWHETKLERQIEHLELHPDCDILGTQAWDVRDPLSAEPAVAENCFAIGQYRTDAEIKARLPDENVMAHSSIVMRRSVFLALGGYDTGRLCRGKEDWCLWTKAAAAGHRFHNLPERLLYYSLGTGVAR